MIAAARPASLTAQAFWLMVARTLGFVFSFALPILLVRALDQTQIGLYRQAFLVTATAINVLPLAMPLSAFYYLPRETERRGRTILNILVFVGLVGGLASVVLVLWPDVLGVVFGMEEIVPYGRLLGALLFSWILSSFIEIVATANQDVVWSTWFIVTAQLSKTILLGGAALVFRSVEALLYAAILQGILQTAALIWYIVRAFPGVFGRFDWALFREQTSYALPFGVAGLVYTAQADYHSYLVANGVSAAEYAIYAYGTTQLPLVNLLRDSMNTVLIPRVSQLQSEGRVAEIRSLLLRAVRKSLAFYLPVVCGLLLIGKDLLVAMYTEAYVRSWPIFAINVLLLPFNALMSDGVLRAYSEHRFTALKIRIAVLVATVAICTVGFRYFGMIGAIAGVTLGMMLERVWLFGFALRIIGGGVGELSYLHGLQYFVLACAAAFGAGFAVRTGLEGHAPATIILAAGSVFTGVFAGFVLATGALETDERQIINSQARRFLGRDLLKP